MALSKPHPRKHLHTRDIQCRGFERDDGLWDIEAEIVDTKTYSFDNADRNGVAAGEPVHHMRIRLTLDNDLVVQKAEASTEAAPYGICGDINRAFASLEGAVIAPGWRREVIKRMGGVKGYRADRGHRPPNHFHGTATAKGGRTGTKAAADQHLPCLRRGQQHRQAAMAGILQKGGIRLRARLTCAPAYLRAESPGRIVETMPR